MDCIAVVPGVWKQQRRGRGLQKQSCLDYRLSWTNYSRTRKSHTISIGRSAGTQQPCSSSMRVYAQQPYFNISSYGIILINTLKCWFYPEELSKLKKQLVESQTQLDEIREVSLQQNTAYLGGISPMA